MLDNTFFKNEAYSVWFWQIVCVWHVWLDTLRVNIFNNSLLYGFSTLNRNLGRGRWICDWNSFECPFIRNWLVNMKDTLWWGWLSELHSFCCHYSHNEIFLRQKLKVSFSTGLMGLLRYFQLKHSFLRLVRGLSQKWMMHSLFYHIA